MNVSTMQQEAWQLLLCASSACKHLLWLSDADSPQRLVPQLREPLTQALHTVIRFPNALPALQKKMYDIYKIALTKPFVGI